MAQKKSVAPKMTTPLKKNLVRMDSDPTNASSIDYVLPKLTDGMRVEHDRFGRGKIASVEGTYPEQKISIDFADVGVKNLLLKFAKLKVLESL